MNAICEKHPKTTLVYYVCVECSMRGYRVKKYGAGNCCECCLDRFEAEKGGAAPVSK